MPDKYENMLFNNETSYRTDYRVCEIGPTIKTVYKEKPNCLRIRPPPLKDIHTLTEWKKSHIPIDLFLRPKEIVRTNPHHIQQSFEKPIDLDLELAKKTRPRLVMTPAISMDDISSPKKRKVLVNDVYSTTAHRAMREGIPPVSSESKVSAPLSDTPAPANPITFQKLQPPYVSPEWRMESASWDGRQLRAHCEPDKEFYLTRTPKCAACDVTAALEMQKKMKKK
ncbi:unnamed protein product [Euphydryas editha]|uniref:Uncharacterized protein n=1 Tax=Euphydryas editha TaxID=104508 RepID=A0AAU9V7B5_EUPED|nr:unnamed protein product [Euphydryas editha]